MLFYRVHFKYYAAERLVFETGIESAGFELPFCGITPAGSIWTDRWFGWDGASWAPDCWARRGSRGHDAGYRLLRQTPLGNREFQARRLAIDQMFHAVLLDAGMPRWLANWYYAGVRKGGKGAAAPKPRKLYTAR